MQTRFKTDTATLIVVDPACVRHRLNDDADWWSIPADEIAEINLGNTLFVSLVEDGVYELAVVTAFPPADAKRVESLIKNQSGRFFLGAGEYMTSEGLEPQAIYGNVFVEVPLGVYRAVVWRTGAKIFVNLALSDEPAVNAFTRVPRLE